VLGIDTSNYTTSLAVVDEDLQAVANIKLPLPVAEGERGLRQSDAVFAHVKNLPVAFEKAQSALKGMQLCAVGVSERPRNQEGSYMPCFLAGVSAATAAAHAAQVPLMRWSHQCGHMMAAIFGSGALQLLDAPFGAFHVSGGTTELVRASLAENGFQVEVVGGSRDLHAGQVIDRIGVALGMRFPAGAELERAAMSCEVAPPHRKPASEGTFVHLSGLENMAMKLYRDTGDKALTAAFVFDYIGASLEAMSRAYLETYGQMPLLYAGGVMSSTLLQRRLAGKFDGYFAPPSLSSDNAVGVAVLTARKIF
jgi:N6-L-threonylcarbamoyladenine synthase